MGQLQTRFENVENINSFLKSLPDSYQVSTGRVKLSSEDRSALRNLRDNIDNLMLNAIFRNEKINYSLAKKEFEWMDMTNTQEKLDIMKVRCQGILLQLGDIPLRAIDDMYMQSRKFSEFPTATSLLKSWNAIRGDYSESEKKKIKGFLSKPDDMHTREDTTCVMR